MKVHQIKIDFQVTEQVKRYVFVYLIEAQSCYLIDSGVAGCEIKIAQYMKKIGRDIAEIKGIFLTHAHPDHIGTAAWFKEHVGSKIYASAGERRWIEDINLQYKERPIPNFYNLAGQSVNVDCEVRDGEAIELEEGLTLQLFSTPGHSADEMSYRLKEYFFIGDSIPVKGDIPIYINKEELLHSLQVIGKQQEVTKYCPAWDCIYTAETITEKLRDAAEFVDLLDQQTQIVLNEMGCSNMTAVTDAVCERMGMNYWKQNPLFQRTLQAHIKL